MPNCHRRGLGFDSWVEGDIYITYIYFSREFGVNLWLSMCFLVRDY